MALRAAWAALLLVSAVLFAVQLAVLPDVSRPVSAPAQPPFVVHVVNLFEGAAVTAGGAGGAPGSARDEYELARASWARAAEYARAHGVVVDLVAACYKRDLARLARPPFRAARPLEHSFNGSKRLPLLAEILERGVESSAAPWVVYTNSDIIMREDAYVRIAELVRSLRGVDTAFSVTRRDIPPVDRESTLAEVEATEGVAHKGHDTFVMPRGFAARLARAGLGRLAIGYSPVGCFLLQALAQLGPVEIARDSGWTLHTTATDEAGGGAAKEAYAALRERRKAEQMQRNRHGTIVNWLNGAEALRAAQPAAMRRCCAMRPQRGMYACCVAHTAVADADLKRRMLASQCDALDAPPPPSPPAANASSPLAAAAAPGAARPGGAAAAPPVVLVVLEHELDVRIEAHAYALRLLDYLGRSVGAKLIVAHVRRLGAAGAGARALGGPHSTLAWGVLPVSVLQHEALGGREEAERARHSVKVSETDLTPINAAWLRQHAVDAIVAVLPGAEPAPRAPAPAAADARAAEAAPTYPELLAHLAAVVGRARAKTGKRLPLALATAGAVSPDDAPDAADSAGLERDEAAADSSWEMAEAAEAAWRARLVLACARGVDVVLAGSETERELILARRPCARPAAEPASDAAPPNPAAGVGGAAAPAGDERLSDAAAPSAAAAAPQSPAGGGGAAAGGLAPAVEAWPFSTPSAWQTLQREVELEFEGRQHVLFVGTPRGRAEWSVRWLLGHVWPLVGIVDTSMALTLIGGYATSGEGKVKFVSWAHALARAKDDAARLGRSAAEQAALQRVYALTAPPSDLRSVLRMHRVLVEPAFSGGNATGLAPAATLALANGAAVLSTTARGIGCVPRASARPCEAVRVAPASDPAAFAAALVELHDSRELWHAHAAAGLRHAGLQLSTQALMDRNALERLVDLARTPQPPPPPGSVSGGGRSGGSS